MTTRIEATEIRDAILALEEFETQQRKVITDQEKATALIWYNTVKPRDPTTRFEAYTAYNTIKALEATATDKWRIQLLRTELIRMNKEARRLKRAGT